MKVHIFTFYPAFVMFLVKKIPLDSNGAFNLKKNKVSEFAPPYYMIGHCITHHCRQLSIIEL